MKFSIIIPVFNEEKYLGPCLESLVSQAFDKQDFEIVVVDNNCCDKTKEIASGFPGVRVVSESKQGYVLALIRGCQEARGEILVFIDADAFAPKTWLSRYRQIYRDEKVVMAGGLCKFRPVTWLSFFVEPILYFAGLAGGFVNGPNFSIRRQTYFEINGFDPKVNFNADAYLQMKARKAGKTVFSKDNFVICSSRRFRNLGSLVYIAKSLTNIVSLFIFGKTIFYEFSNIR